MRFHRSKLTRKYLKFYRIVFGLNSPYDILLDGNFIFSSIKYKIDLKDTLSKLLQVRRDDIKLYTTRSIVDELQLAGKPAAQALEFSMKYCIILENGGNSTMTALDKLTSYLRSSACKKKFFVASQDKSIRNAVAMIPGIPTLYFNKVIMVLESPSEASKQFHNQKETLKEIIKPSEMELVKNFNNRKPCKRKENDDLTNAIINNVNSVSSNNELKISPKIIAPKVIIRDSNIRKKAKAANPLSHKDSNQNSRTSKKKKKEAFF